MSTQNLSRETFEHFFIALSGSRLLDMQFFDNCLLRAALSPHYFYYLIFLLSAITFFIIGRFHLKYKRDFLNPRWQKCKNAIRVDTREDGLAQSEQSERAIDDPDKESAWKRAKKGVAQICKNAKMGKHRNSVSDYSDDEDLDNRTRTYKSRKNRGMMYPNIWTKTNQRPTRKPMRMICSEISNLNDQISEAKSELEIGSFCSTAEVERTVLVSNGNIRYNIRSGDNDECFDHEMDGRKTNRFKDCHVDLNPLRKRRIASSRRRIRKTFLPTRTFYEHLRMENNANVKL